ncbi:iron-siderophore ABC transporter substrate-binding protein [Desmonostoc muscorum LEGE 12446]|uniref:Iron-siderophore ABC transporter substrate-binding protein n=1 Tax=Desmonostoc muscorum LEGE 12446 TaxID=1828758 RepID=A0A8J6ZMA9_DESMC|nr:iron-siderophore ABC transporter substrate-binding protein [Desmonostoc muscorum]MCF2149922.1 iron-siderophore ABC transporter substrate-binding protein [Desmonostoc muscorum LEGE 12446]
MRKFFCWLILGILGFILIAACNYKIPKTVSSLPHASPVECHIVKHTMGETCVPNKPQRIVTLSLSTLGNVLALGVKPIGTTNEYYREENFLNSSYKTDEIKLIGFDKPNLEAILLLKPDLIIGVDWFKSVYPQLSEIAPTVLGEMDYSTWQKHLSFVAEALGKQEAEKMLWNRYYQRIERLKLALRTHHQDKKISLIYVSGDRILIDVKNSFAGSIISNARLQRPASQNIESPYGAVSISLEELEKADGDILFVATFANGGNQFLEKKQQSPLWKQLKAVQKNHVYHVNITSWSATHMIATDAVIDDLFKYLVNTP